MLVTVVVALYLVGSNANSPKPLATGTHPNKPQHHPAHTHPGTSTLVPHGPLKVKLQLVPTGTVYVCLVNGRGIKLINEQTFTVNDTIPTETGSKLLLTLGNASVQMKVNGNPVTVAPSPTAIRYLLTPTVVQHIPLSTQPTCP